MGHYIFTLKVKTNSDSFQIDRRYSDFDLLRRAIEVQWPGLFIPCLPPKDALISFSKEDSLSLKKRKVGIRNFMQTLLTHESLGSDNLVCEFLETRAEHQF